ncbi:uncharacterized protein KIAA2012 homolog isoform X2 [Alligator mississippiensis]|uniref:HSA domain-containing protein n=1 Tax=Alligator mississippiensis TaxID=8496 RepID=A0A151N981_ALLMI|nr:uncharacterized protein KIAA2012 homolog isoform X2 [Alligator mississippiensis]KYO33388.1 hypothetical protein Y1Q_0008616 [Alligator mississippiensis]
MPNLSLLSRGIGQVVKKTQEKLEVHFEPEDYLNWKACESYRHVSKSLTERSVMKDGWGLYLPKTYSTRTGALVLYSEDLAEPSWKQRGGRKGPQGHRHRRKKLQIELHTLQDLTRAILAYGGNQKDRRETARQPYLHFLNKPDNQIERQIRPGYSAKRYLFKLSETWDPNIIYRLQCAGYIRDPLLLQENFPDCRKRQQNLSAIPEEYHLLPKFPSFWAELDQNTHPDTVEGQNYLFRKEPEKGRKLAENYEVEIHGRRRAQAPIQVSVRKLGMKLRPQPAKDTTWSHHAACTWVPQSTGAEGQLDSISTVEGQWHREKANHIGRQGDSIKINHTAENSSRKAAIDSSQLLSEKSHMTFYGGYFPRRKKSYNVKGGHLKNQDGQEQESLLQTSIFPPFPPGMNSGQDTVRGEHKKLVSEMLKLPSVSEETPRTQRTHRKPPEELLILPLLVQLQNHTKSKTKKQRGASCYAPKSEASCETLLATSLNNLISGTEGATEQDQVIIEGNTESHQDDDSVTQNAAPTLGLLSCIYGKKIPVTQSSRENLKTPSSSIFTNSTSQALPMGTIHGALPEELRECHNGTSLGSLIMGPDGEIICLSLLESVQNADVPNQLNFTPGEGDCGLPLEAGTNLHTNPHETSLTQERSDKKTAQFLEAATLKNREPQSFINKKLVPDDMPPLMHPHSDQTLYEIRTEQEDRLCIRNDQGCRSMVPEFQGEQRQEIISGHPRVTQDKPTSSLLYSDIITQTAGAKQQDDGDFVKELQREQHLRREETDQNSLRTRSHSVLKMEDPDKQMDGALPSNSILHLGSDFAYAVNPIEEITSKRVRASESGNQIVGPPSHGLMLEEKAGASESHSEKQLLTEIEETTLPEEPGEQTAASFSSDTEVSQNKPMKRERNKFMKMNPESTTQKESSNKDKHYIREEFVVGKPKEKKADEKRKVSLKKKATGIKRPKTTHESHQEAGGQTDESSAATAGDEEAGDDSSLSPSNSSVKDQEHPPDGHQLSTEDCSYPPAFGSAPADKRFTPAPPLITKVCDTESMGGQSREVSENLPENQHEKSSRERMRAEKAERRRLEVERKRREQEEQKRKQQEQQERMEKMKEELEQEQQRRIEEMRLLKQQLEEEHQRQEEAAARKLQEEKAAQERVRQQQEEYRRKLLELQKKKQQEEQERAEAEKCRQKEREMWLEEERQRLAEMAEEERLEYERRKCEAEEQARRDAEEKRRKAEEEAKLALEEAKKQAQLLARQRTALEKHLQFQQKLLMEATGLEHTQDISRPWVYSYFQLLQILGLETTEENK